MVVFACIVVGVVVFLYNWGELRLFCFAGYCLGIVIALILLKTLYKFVVRKKIAKLLGKAK